MSEVEVQKGDGSFVEVALDAEFGVVPVEEDDDQQHRRRSSAHPGPGEQAPGCILQASDGEAVQRSDDEGKSVLLHFENGIGCQPCGDQIRDVDKESPAVGAAGIEEILCITTSPPDLVNRDV